MPKNSGSDSPPNQFPQRHLQTNISGKAQLRAREPIGRSFGLVRGKFPSRKMDRMIHWESQLERDAVLLFEFSPGVTAYQEQPFTAHYTIDDKTRRYTPDFEITLTSGETVVIEIKPEQKLLEPVTKRKFEHILRYFDRRGQPFLLLTEANIRQAELLENLRLLVRHRGRPLSTFERRCCGALNIDKQ